MKNKPEYHKFTGPAQLDKAVNSLLGILEGVSLDGVINPDEMVLLSVWLKENREYEHRHPFTELFPVIANALIDNELTDEEHANITWLAEKLRSTEFYDEIAADLQRLQGIMIGIAADNIVSKTELLELSDWLADHDHLRTRYPFDEMDSLITSVLADRKIDADENKLLLSFLSDFSPLPNVITGEVNPPTIHGLCAVSPQVIFENSIFCFTGESDRYSREELFDLVAKRGGHAVKTISKKINYLVIGADGNPCWKYACYGRKVEQAIQLRREGATILIIHESDFREAVEN